MKEDGYVVLKNILDDNSEKIVCSNDFQLLKRLMSEGFKVYFYTKCYKSKIISRAVILKLLSQYFYINKKNYFIFK